MEAMSKLNLLKQLQNNAELMLNLQEIEFNINNYQQFEPLFQEYLNNYHQCEKLLSLSLCQQPFKGYKYYIKKKMIICFNTN